MNQAQVWHDHGAGTVLTKPARPGVERGSDCTPVTLHPGRSPAETPFLRFSSFIPHSLDQRATATRDMCHTPVHMHSHTHPSQVPSSTQMHTRAHYDHSHAQKTTPVTHTCAHPTIIFKNAHTHTPTHYYTPTYASHTQVHAHPHICVHPFTPAHTPLTPAHTPLTHMHMYTHPLKCMHTHKPMNLCAHPHILSHSHVHTH